ENPPESNFCGRCAAPLDRTGDSAASEPIRAPPAELKRVSMLFCDLVGSTPLAARLGAETMHELIRWFIDTALAEVERYEGTTPQFSGDGFLALFGAPITYEDHVRRALLAAIAIREAVSGKPAQVPGGCWPDLQIRIGIHTGLVVFGSVGGNLRMDPTAIGDAANIAARLQTSAAPGTILISEETCRLAQGYAQVEPVGLLALKGKDEPVAAYRLLGVSHRLISGGPAAPGRPFVGRTDEIVALDGLLRSAKAGTGRLIDVVGEPGIGKSRLLNEFRRRQGGGASWVEGRCLSYGTMTPYLLVLDLLRGLCGIVETDTAETVIAKLRATLQEVGMDPDQDSVLLHLLGIQELARAPALASPEAVKARAFAAMRQLILYASRRRQLLLVVEDLHWLDKVSEEFLGFLGEAVADTPILVLATYRSGYQPPWIDKPYAGQLPLNPLSRTDSLDLVRAVAGRLDAPVTDAIVSKADGNPFFLEQLAFDAGEARAARPAEMVPNTIRDVVMARIDRLPSDAKRLLQTASVIGREFPLRLLRAVWQGKDPIEPHLHELIRLEFIHERFDSERTAYVFRHALTQETAYASLLKRYRGTLHAAVGTAIEENYAERTDEFAEPLAFHFGRSNDDDKAVDYAILAAQKAQRRCAYNDAVAYFEGAAERLEEMPDLRVNRVRRVDAVIKQAEVKLALGRHAEHIGALEKIRDLVAQLDDPQRRVAWHYWTGYLRCLTGGHPVVTIDHCRQAAAIASGAGYDRLHGLVDSCLAQAYVVAGQLHAAIEAGERALSIFDARTDPWLASRALWHLSSAANHLGDWEASLAYCRRALQYATDLDDQRFKTAALWRTGSAYIQQGDTEPGLRYCEEALALRPIPYDSAVARMIRGYGMIKAGRVDAGVAELTDVVAWFEDSQLAHVRSITCLWLVEGYLAQGNTVGARPLIEKIIETCRNAGYRYYEGLAHRVMADCIASELPLGAERHAAEGLRIFEDIGARNDFAKALMSRAALRRQSGNLPEARELFRQAHGIFVSLGTRGEPARVETALAELDDAAQSSGG
ncbi:MAG TPA: AAA family ATPase, partial [Stellaceae bacterium]|nr:AAA family ATPase [Stellaceae bacterium]